MGVVWLDTLSQIRVLRYFTFCVLIRSQAERLVSRLKFETVLSNRESDSLFGGRRTLLDVVQLISNCVLSPNQRS